MHLVQLPLFGTDAVVVRAEVNLMALTGDACVRVEVHDGRGGALLALRQVTVEGWLTPRWYAAELAVLIAECIEDVTEPFPDHPA